MEARKWYHKWATQFRLLLWKNWLLSTRNKKTAVIQMAAPAVFIFILWMLQASLTLSPTFGDLYKVVRHPEEQAIPSIPLCITGPRVDECWTFVYAPDNDTEVDEIMELVAAQNDPPIPASSILKFPSDKDVDEFLLANLNSTQGAFLFEFFSNGTGPRQLRYTVQVNQTDNFSHGVQIPVPERILMPMHYAVERAILQLLAGVTTFNYEVSLVPFAHPEILAVDVIGENGPVFFFAALMFSFVVGLGQIVQEKENKLREIMKVMGLYDSVFWTTWFLTLSFFSTVAVLVLIIFGAIFQFRFFLNNNFGLYFLLLELFALTLVPMTFLISTIVKKSKSATAVGFLVFILGFMLQLGGAIVFSESAPGSVRIIFSLFSPAMLQLGLSNLGAATAKESYEGLSWSDVNSTERLASDSLTFNQMYGWLILDFFLYLVVALWLDNVMPNEYGTRRAPWYFLTPSYWTGTSRPSSSKKKGKITQVEELNEFDEDVLAERDAVLNGDLPDGTAVKIDCLNKTFADTSGGCCKGSKAPFVAVNDLCLSIQSDTLFCLLGPNGAGKTTTIHMMVGFHEASAGDAIVFGNSIRSNISSVQQMMGICPQFDILWAELSAEEHLSLFAGLRNLSREDIPKEVNRLLEEVHLEDSRKMRSAAFSGGMKRRLSVAIALIGDPKIVFLDEPTTGMDPVSRRQVWNIIERAKKDKVIVLTTHSMEEADVLGDRIGIMARGRLQCLGSSLHLKQKFGAGYKVTVGTTKDVALIKAFFEKHIKGSKAIGDAYSGYMNFSVPRDSTSELVAFFKKLEKHSKKLGVKDLQLSLTTLEEVFLTVAETAELKHIQHKIAEKNEDYKEDKSGSDIDMESQKKGDSGELRLYRRDQFQALFIKTATLQKRDMKTNICQASTPVFLILLLFLFQILINSIIDIDPVDEVLYPLTTPPFHALNRDDVDIAKFFDVENPDPDLINLLTNGARLVYTAAPDVGNYEAGTGLLGLVSPPAGEVFPIKFLEFNEFGVGMNESFIIPSLPAPFRFDQFSTRDELDDEIFEAFGSFPEIPGGYNFKRINIDANTLDISYSVHYNESLENGLTLSYLNNRISRAIGLSLDDPIELILLGIKEFPTLKDTPFEIDIVTLAGSFFYVLILMQLLPVFLANIVGEKENKVKDVMTMMGLKMEVYWMVEYLFDFMLYFMLMMLTIIAGLIFQFRIFTINNFLSYFLLFFLWGHVLIAIAFFLSSFFASRKTALVVGYFSIIGVALICVVLIESILGDIGDVSNGARLGLSIIPPFALYRGLIYLAAEVSWEGPGYQLDTMSEEVVNIGEVYIFLVLQWVVLMALWWYFEKVIPSGWGVKKHPLFFLGFKFKSDVDVIEKEDSTMPEDVAAEHATVMAKENNPDWSVHVMGMRKVYPGQDGNPPKVAVKGVSFGVEHNSCFGILGHNGAGKTTLLSMLIGLFRPTKGNAFINGLNLNEELDGIHKIMGICPQHDVLWDTLTGKEHLMFYGRIKGLSGKRLKHDVATILKKVNLYDARNKVSCKYSGGMKRRLSVGISIIAQPKIIFMDEPSTGLDPKSRQDLWGVIQEAKKDSCVILTTHSMEEADALCDRLAIMSDGEMKCIGVSGDLKNRFGSAFKLSVQVSKGKKEEPADEFIRALAPDVTLINELAGTRNYEVPKQGVNLEKVFTAMEGQKEKLNITDWAITNTTLEEVFLKISLGEHQNAHEDNKGEEKKRKKNKSSKKVTPEKKPKKEVSESSKEEESAKRQTSETESS